MNNDKFVIPKFEQPKKEKKIGFDFKLKLSQLEKEMTTAGLKAKDSKKEMIRQNIIAKEKQEEIFRIIRNSR